MSAIKRVSEQALNHLKRLYTPSDFKPRFIYKNMWGRKRYMHPKVSLRKLADMRKNAEYLGINTESIGLPPKKEKNPPRTKPPKGAKHERNAPARKAKIQKALDEMQKTIENWRKDKLQEKEKGKPSLPF